MAWRWRRVQGYLANRQPAPARAELEAMRAQDADDVRTHLVAAHVAWRDDHLRAATAAALAACRVVPDDAELLCDTIAVLLQVGEIVAARACLARPALADAGSPAALLRTADFMQRLNQHDQSLALVERAIAAGADDPETRFHHGAQLYFHGRIAAAEGTLDACLTAMPAHGRAAYTRSFLKVQTAASNHLAELAQGLAQVERGSRDHAALEFARYKELEDLGRCGDAWRALAAANALMHARNPYDAVARGAFFDRLVGARVADRLPNPGDAVVSGPQPIFILGLPRSGTTLLDRLLGNHSAVQSAGELTDFGAQLQWALDTRNEQNEVYVARLATLGLGELGRRYLAQTQWRAGGRRFFIDKQPPNWVVAGVIHAALPGAKIIHLERDPMDQCFSDWRAFFGDAYGFSYDLATLSAHYRAYRRVMARWHAVLPGAILGVPYADLVRDPDATLRRVFDYCGLAWEPGCADLTRNTAPVATPDVGQLRGPLHTHAGGAWRRYATQLEPLSAVLGRHEFPAIR